MKQHIPNRNIVQKHLELCFFENVQHLLYFQQQQLETQTYFRGLVQAEGGANCIRLHSERPKR